MYVILQENFQDIVPSKKKIKVQNGMWNVQSIVLKWRGKKNMNVYLFLYENIVIISEGELQQDLEDRWKMDEREIFLNSTPLIHFFGFNVYSFLKNLMYTIFIFVYS